MSSIIRIRHNVILFDIYLQFNFNYLRELIKNLYVKYNDFIYFVFNSV